MNNRDPGLFFVIQEPMHKTSIFRYWCYFCYILETKSWSLVGTQTEKNDYWWQFLGSTSFLVHFGMLLFLLHFLVVNHWHIHMMANVHVHLNKYMCTYTHIHTRMCTHTHTCLLCHNDLPKHMWTINYGLRFRKLPTKENPI